MMGDFLKKYAVDGLRYIDKNELIEALKHADNAYYIDDLNYLTMPNIIDCLCGYLPGTTPERNFCYVRIFGNSWQFDPNNPPQFRLPKGYIISCCDLDAAERFLDLFYENRVFNKYFLNLPAKFEGMNRSAEEVLQTLLDKYKGYYRIASKVFDYRFEDFCDDWDRDDRSIEISLAEQDIFGDDVQIFDKWYVLRKEGKPVLAYGYSPYYHPDRIGTKFFSFDNSLHAYGDNAILEEDVLHLWKFLAHKYIEEGYIVKGIAINDGFDNDEMYLRMGMAKYRCFLKLITDNAKDG